MPGRSTHSPAFALVVVLGMVVIITVLVLAFFSRVLLEAKSSTASANSANVDILARSAADFVLGDLRQEMASASTVTNSTTASNTNTVVYLPKMVSKAVTSQTTMPTPVGMLPWKSGVPANNTIPNLVRRSVRAGNTAGPSPFSAYPGDYTTPPQNRAADDSAAPASVNSATPSKNGRFISPARWNQHYLMPLLNPASTDDTTPIADFVPPDWIVVTRDGPKAVTSADLPTLRNGAPTNNGYAIGRYAFAIYDVGGLLDANLAGFPDSMAPGDSGRKGSVAFADLSQINPSLSTPKINTLVGWRNFATAQPGGTFPNYTFPTASGTRYLDALMSNTNGFLAANPISTPATAGTRTDQRFTSRQALIKFARAIGLNASSLMSLNTFSRDLNSPSFSPKNPVPASYQPADTFVQTIDYELGANMPAASARTWKSNGWLNPSASAGTVMPYPNRNLVRTVWNSDRTIKDWDGNDVQVKSGDSVVKRRFPLSRLDLFRQYEVASSAEKPAIAQKILYSFGLIPDPDLPGGWIYNAYTLTNMGGRTLLRLFTIDEIQDGVASPGSTLYDYGSSTGPGKGRELNFFELIRLGVLHGEMGNFSVTMDDPDSGIMTLRMGANIIDQYDADSYPTQIRVQTPVGLENPFSGGGMQIAGIENLPYISEIMGRVYRKQAGPENDPERKKAAAWFEFELWNPHANAGVSPSGAAPSDFRIVPAVGSIFLRPTTSRLTAPDGTTLPLTFWDTSVIDFSSSYSASANSPHQIQFQYPGTSSFVEPAVLGSSAATTAVTYGTPSKQVYSEPGKGSFGGIFLGETDNPDGWPDSTLSPTNPLKGWFSEVTIMRTGGSSNPYTFALEYRDARNGGRWVPYQSLTFRSDIKISIYDYGLIYPNSGMPTAPWVTYPSIGSLPFQGITFGVIGYSFSRIDPRGSRFGVPTELQYTKMAPTPGFTIRPDLTRGILPTLAMGNWGQSTGEYPTGDLAGALINMTSYPAPGWRVLVPTNQSLPGWDKQALADLVENRPSATAPNRNGAAQPSEFQSVLGRDKIMRPGDGDRDKGVHPLVASATANRPFLQNVIAANPTAAALVGVERLNDRPLMLNRPFQSVGELAYAFRDLPWKTINFSSPVSAEAGLLDLFSVNETPFAQPVVAGRVNLNSAPREVLKALLVGSSRNDVASVQISAANADTIVNDFIAMRAANPLRDRSDLIGNFWRYLEDNNKIGNSAAEPYPAIKTRQESISRAWGEVGMTRTWNLLVDIVAQSGRYPATANSLADFVVQGEKHYWLHVAIDRFTGKIIDQQFEPVDD